MAVYLEGWERCPFYKVSESLDQPEKKKVVGGSADLLLTCITLRLASR